MLRVNFRLPRSLSEGEGDKFYWISPLIWGTRVEKKISPLSKRDYLGKLLGQALYDKYSSLEISISRTKFFYR